MTSIHDAMKNTTKLEKIHATPTQNIETTD